MLDAATKPLVVDCDTHFWQPFELWEKFLDKKHRPSIEAFVRGYETKTFANKNLLKSLNEDASGKRYDAVGDDPGDRPGVALGGCTRGAEHGREGDRSQRDDAEAWGGRWTAG